MLAPEDVREMAEAVNLGATLPLVTAISMPTTPSPSTPCNQQTDCSAWLGAISSSSGNSSVSSTNRSRKSTTPLRSVPVDDPAFCGIRFRFHLSTPSPSPNASVSTSDMSLESPELTTEKEYVRIPDVSTTFKLNKTERYTPLCQRRKRPVDYDKLSPPAFDCRSPTRDVVECESDSSEEEFADPPPKAQKTKQLTAHRHLKVCASCSSTKSPMWRDTEEGIPLCNACGIRYKRYHCMCSYCRYVPRKDEKTWISCKLCGHKMI